MLYMRQDDSLFQDKILAVKTTKNTALSSIQTS